MVKRTRRSPAARRGARTARGPSATSRDAGVARAFVAESRRRLRREYLPKIRAAVRLLGARDLWWRPHPRCNSAGNLLLHLEGNVRQWILSGLGGRRDARHRDAEFEAQDGIPASVLLGRLDRTLQEVDKVLARLGPEELLEERTIQGYRVTGLQAVYHVVEHFSGHTGQILYAAKQRRGRDLELYPHLASGKAPSKRARSARHRFL